MRAKAGRLRILYVSDGFWPYIGGIEVVAARLLPALVRRGHVVASATLHGRLTLPDDDTFRGVEVHRFRLKAMAPLEEFDGLASARALDRAAWVTACSQAVLDDARRTVPGIAERSSLLYGVLAVPALDPAPLPFDPPTVLALARLDRTKGLDLLIPNAILPGSRPKDTHRERADALLSVGHLGSPKDHRTLVEAVARLKESHPALTLTIYGEGPERGMLVDLVRTRGLESRVRLPGFTAGIAERLRNFDLFLFSSRYEGFPNALGEAMSAGLPVIASDGPGNQELVRDRVNGRVFPAGDVAALASIIAELHGDRAGREALAQAARGASDTFSVARVAALWDDVFSGFGGLRKTVVDTPTRSGSGSGA